MLNLAKSPHTHVIKMTADEQAREDALRQRFASFWASAGSDMRAAYDVFISGSPMVAGVSLEAVDRDDVKGWWVRPSQPSLHEAILYIHGGGYVLGSPKAYRGFVSQIVERTQVPAFILEYPLAPEATLPAGPNTALAAWRYLINEGFERVAIVGDSAGGGLSLVTLTALSKQASGLKPLVGVVFSPWVDMTFSGASMTDHALQDPLIGYEYLNDCSQKYRGSISANDPLASPLFGDLGRLPPLLIQVGSDERLFDDSRQFADSAVKAGVAVRFEVWEGMHHVFQLDVAHLESSRNALDRAASFLRLAFGRV